MPIYDKSLTVQKITAPTYEEAKKRLFDRYKYDYSIMDKRQVLKGGFLGMFGQREEVEVSYTVKNRSESVSDHYPLQERGMAPVRSGNDSFMRNRDDILKKNNESMIVSAKLATMQQSIDRLTADVGKKLQSLADSTAEVPRSIVQIEELLLENDFTAAYIKEMIARIKRTFSLEQLEDFDLIERSVVDWIGESIAIAPATVSRKPHVIIIVGPTGVGKTTTLVKLATQYFLQTHRNNITPQLCFLTTDSIRVGAMEQLNRFSEIFGTGVMKAEKAEDVKKIYEDYRDKVDAIFVDTSGCSPNDAGNIANMKTTLDVQWANPEVYLAVMASTKARDMKKIMQNYEPFGYQSVIITKCDESDQYGNIISVLSERHKSVSYLTNGQNAAKDIARASVVDFLIRLENFKIDRVHIEDKFGVK